MKLADFVKPAGILLILLLSVGCNQSNGGGTFGGFLEQDKQFPTARTRDGRLVLLKPGAWEYDPPDFSPRMNLTAVTKTGRVVYLKSDGTWGYAHAPSSSSGGGLTRSKAPAPPSFIHIYQHHGGRGKASVYLDGERIADLREKRYFVIAVKPGGHTFNIAKRDQGGLFFNTIGGRHYYVKNSEGFGGWGEKFRLMSVSASTDEMCKHKMQPIEGQDIFKYDLVVVPEMSTLNPDTPTPLKLLCRGTAK